MGRLLLGGFESKLGRGEFARLNRMGHRCSNRIQIDICRACQDRFLVQQSDRFETALEEFPNLLVFLVRTRGDFLESTKGHTFLHSQDVRDVHEQSTTKSLYDARRHLT